MLKNVSNQMTRGQGDEICNQIEIACKRLGENPQEVVRELLGTNFFGDAVQQHLWKLNKGMPSISGFSVESIINTDHLGFGLIFSNSVKTKLFINSDNRGWREIDAYRFRDISTYILPEELGDNEIKGLTNSYPLSSDIFWQILYLLTYLGAWTRDTLKIGLLKEKNYLMHIKNSPGEFYTISLKLTVPDGNKPMLNVDLFPFDESKRDKGDVFIYLADL